MKKQPIEARKGDCSSGRTVSSGLEAESAVNAGDAYKNDMAPVANLVVGRLVGFRDSGFPLVDFPFNVSGQLLEARSVVDLSQKDLDQEVVLAFEDGDARRPIIMGTIRASQSRFKSASEESALPKSHLLKIEMDDETLTITAEKQLILRCGKSSITLTRAGKVIIRGEHLLSRSSGVNRIKGGSVQIN